jgi:hypothetical protein
MVAAVDADAGQPGRIRRGLAPHRLPPTSPASTSGDIARAITCFRVRGAHASSRRPAEARSGIW